MILPTWVNELAEGAVLLSGYSPSLLKLVMNRDALQEEEVEVIQGDGTIKTEKIRVTPEQVLRKMLDNQQYDPVCEILASSREVTLLEFGMTEKKLTNEANGKADDDGSLVE